MVVRDDNYFQVSGWMLNKLHLKGTALEVYAIIYGFSQDGESEFTGSLQYLCDFTGGTTKPTIIKALKELTAKQYIIRREEFVNNVQFNRYKANLHLLNNLNGDSKETLTGGSKEILMGGSKETLPNNKSLYNKSFNNKTDSKKERKNTSYDDILSQINDDSLRDLYLEYIKMRKMIKAPMTDRALTMLIKRVNELEPTDINRQKRLLETALMNNWKSVYPLKEDKNAKTEKYSSYDIDDFARAAIERGNTIMVDDDPELKAEAEALKKELAEKY